MRYELCLVFETKIVTDENPEKITSLFSKTSYVDKNGFSYKLLLYQAIWIVLRSLYRGLYD